MKSYEVVENHGKIVENRMKSYEITENRMKS